MEKSITIGGTRFIEYKRVLAGGAQIAPVLSVNTSKYMILNKPARSGINGSFIRLLVAEDYQQVAISVTEEDTYGFRISNGRNGTIPAASVIRAFTEAGISSSTRTS